MLGSRATAAAAGGVEEKGLQRGYDAPPPPPPARPSSCPGDTGDVGSEAVRWMPLAPWPCPPGGLPEESEKGSDTAAAVGVARAAPRGGSNRCQPSGGASEESASWPCPLRAEAVEATAAFASAAAAAETATFSAVLVLSRLGPTSSSGKSMNGGNSTSSPPAAAADSATTGVGLASGV
jgi:hypothetical protein